MEKIILYGAGKELNENYNEIIAISDAEVLCVVDSDTEKCGKFIGDLEICLVSQVRTQYDFIVITCSYAYEIKKQLIEAGVEEKKIVRLKEYLGYKNKNVWQVFRPTNNESCQENCYQKSVAAIVPVGEFNGACIAMIYFLIEMRKKGFSVGIAATRAEDGFIKYAVNNNIEVCVYRNLEFASYDEFGWIGRFNIVIVNTLTAHKAVQNLHHDRVYWWIHESQSSYDYEIRLWGEFNENDYFVSGVFGVSDMAINVFHRFFPNTKIDKFEYGLPDYYLESPNGGSKLSPIIIAIIGRVSREKGLDIFVEAINELSNEYYSKCEFWIIGKLYDDDFCKELLKQVGDKPIMFFGEMDPNEIRSIYYKVDVVVNASRMDSLPIVITEAFMNKKIAVMSDVIGTVRYIESKRDAFVFRSEDSSDLARVLKYVVDNYSELDFMRDNARLVYEKVFSLSGLDDRIDQKICNIGVL